MVQLGVSYFGNRFLTHAKEDLKRIASSCDYVVHPVNEADLTYHKAALSKIISESRKLGLEVWVDPWALGGVFGGEAFSKFLLEQVAPTYFIINRKDHAKLVEVLEEEDYMPKPEIETFSQNS